MKKPLYKRELSHSYLIVEDVPKELSGHYQYRMILRNRIPGLLASSERFIEGKACLYYDISSRQSLEQLYMSERIGMKEIRGIIDNLVQVLDSMSEYLLEERCLVLKPEYIYMDLETEQLFFLYYPFQEEEEGEIKYLQLAEFFLEHVDHREEKAVSAAYQFYKMSKAKSFMVESFRTFLEKGMDEEEEENGQNHIGREKERFQHEKTERDQWAQPEGRKEEYGYESIPMTGRNSMSFFYEEEGPYEYHMEKEEAPLADAEESRKTQKGNNKKNKDRAGLAAAAATFLLLCGGIWYLKPEGGQKILMFTILALDGLALLIFLWRATAVRQESEEQGEKEEEAHEDSEVFWEEYAPQNHEELDGPTVYMNRNGLYGNGAADGPRAPRLTGEASDASENGMEYSLERLPVLVGKLKSRAQILLSDASVSRIHARFVDREGRTALIDLNSTNGTFVNGVRLEQEEVVVLERGDEIRFGNVQMKYEE